MKCVCYFSGGQTVASLPPSVPSWSSSDNLTSDKETKVFQ